MNTCVGRISNTTITTPLWIFKRHGSLSEKLYANGSNNKNAITILDKTQPSNQLKFFMQPKPQAGSQVEDVRSMFNEMADEYDNLKDLWYPYTFDFIDKVLVKHFSITTPSGSKPIAIDVGCGTGIQSLRLAKLGYKVECVDIANELLKIGQVKLRVAGFSDSNFQIANAESLPFPDSFADCVNCCGPTLSFVTDWKKAIAEMSRCLKPNGKLLLEVEGKWNPDLFWEIINALGFNFLGHDESLGTSLGHLLPPWHIGHSIEYSFKLESGETVTMPLKLFAARELRRELKKVELVQEKRWGLHAITNLIPSTILHDANPNHVTKKLFSFLSSTERLVNQHWPINSFGCSLLILANRLNKTP